MPEMTIAQQRLLMYLETRAVDHRGKIDPAHVNVEDRQQIDDWAREGFIESGRICAADLQPAAPSDTARAYVPNSWVKLSPQAIAAAHALRIARIERGWQNKGYRTTAEYRDEPVSS